MTDVNEGVWTVPSPATVPDPSGLHARPAVALTKLAKSFSAAVEIALASAPVWVDAKSPVAVMKLRVRHGESLLVRAAGADAEQAVASIVTLIERDFT